MLESSKKKAAEYDGLFADKSKKDKNQDAEISRQAAKDEELSRRIDECVEKNKGQDVEIARLVAKDKELDKKIDEGAEKDKSQDEEIARKAAKDEELSRLVNELMQSSLDREAQIRELKSKCDDLTKQIASGSEYVESVESSIKNKLNETASRKGMIVSYIITTAALIASIMQFFV